MPTAGRPFDDWQRCVIKFGYPHEAEMLRDLYERNGLSIRQIAAMLNQKYSNVKYRLRGHGIPLRERGGPNHRKENAEG